jgi:hypothetical protein
MGVVVSAVRVLWYLPSINGGIKVQVPGTDVSFERSKFEDLGF